MSHSKEAAKPGAGPQAACQSLPSCGQEPGPLPPPSQQGGMASEKEIRGLCPEPLWGDSQVVRSLSGFSGPSSALGAPSRDVRVLYFHYAACPVEAPSRLPGSAGFMYLHGSRRNCLIPCQPQDPQLGASQLPPGARVGQTWQGNRSGKDQGSAAPCSEPCSGFWPEPESGLDAPCLVGEQGCRLLGDRSPGSDSGRCWEVLDD